MAAALELARLEARWTGLTDLALDVLFRERVDLWSSAGGEGKLLEPIVEDLVLTVGRIGRGVIQSRVKRQDGYVEMDVMCVSGRKRGMNQTAGKGGGEGCMYNKNVKQQGEEKRVRRA